MFGKAARGAADRSVESTILAKIRGQMELTSLFEQSVEDSKALPDKPSNETLLLLYSLYKQSTLGDNTNEAPGAFDFVAKAKYEAWMALKGKTKDEAMEEYIRLVEKLKS